MTEGKIIRRSGARNLPPSADSHTVPVVMMSDGVGIPRKGTRLRVRAPCGVELQISMREAAPCEGGWIGWADVDASHDSALRDAGVPQREGDSPMRVFSWQVLSEGNR